MSTLQHSTFIFTTNHSFLMKRVGSAYFTNFTLLDRYLLACAMRVCVCVTIDLTAKSCMYQPRLCSHFDFSELWLTLDLCSITHLTNEVLMRVQTTLYLGPPLSSVTSATLGQEIQRVPCLLSTCYWSSVYDIMTSYYVTYVLTI